MTMTILKFLLRLVLAVLIGVIGYGYFSLVFPVGVALVIAWGLGVAELLAPLIAGKGDSGGSLRVLLRVGAALLIWPALSWIAAKAGADQVTAIVLGSAAACALGVLSARRGSGEDNARLAGVIVACALPLYALAIALPAGLLPASAACLAAAVAPLTARQAHIWADRHEAHLLGAAAVALVGGATSATVGFFF
jgi:hypothetical protein